jgi:DNA polymerase-3 subunit delta'
MAKVNAFSKVWGQAQVKTALQQAFERNRLAHALLFHGPKGTGKFATALALSKLVLCEKKAGCGDCPDCKAAGSLSHPDLSITIPLLSPGEPPDRKKEEIRSAAYSDFLEKKKENPYHPAWKENKDLITVPDLQNLQDRLSRKPLQADWQVAILVEADHMQMPRGANKLLKTLEEPHPNRVIILLAERPKNLLPTILSRTQKFFFPPLPAELLADFAERFFGLPKEKAQELARLASGSIANLYFLQS